MTKFLLRRFTATLPVIFGICTVTFFMSHIIPGDVVTKILGETASHKDKEILRKELGLDLPISTQYFNYIGGVTKGDLGRSIHSQSPVGEEILERLPATFELTFFAILFTVLIGIPLGVYSAISRGNLLDQWLFTQSLIGVSLPGIFLGPLLIWIFAVKLDLFPVSERGTFLHVILPATSLAIPLSGVVMRFTRTAMLDVLKEDYIRVAFSKGLTETKVFFVHALKNALPPIITIVGLQTGALLTGTIITETIFDWPGIGTLLYEAITQRDYPLIQGCIFTVACIYVLVNFITDICYGLSNPKVKMS